MMFSELDKKLRRLLGETVQLRNISLALVVAWHTQTTKILRSLRKSSVVQPLTMDADAQSFI